MTSSWDNARDMQFLEYYRAEGSLWDPRHPDHKDVVKRKAAWARVAGSLGVGVGDLKRKKESLLSTYRKLRRGLGGARPSWFAYEFIDEFLGDVRHTRSVWGASETERAEPHGVKREAEAQEDIVTEGSESYFLPEAKRAHSSSMAYVRQAVQLLGLALQGEEEDECALYCRLLATRLRRLPDLARYETMHAIDGLLLRRRESEVYLQLEDGAEGS